MPTAAARRKPHLRSVPLAPRAVQLELPLPEPRWRAPGRPPLWHFVLLSLLLHVLGILLFGAPSGGSREGRAMWGSLEVRLPPPVPQPPPTSLKLDRELAKPVVPDTRPAPRLRATERVRLKPTPAIRVPAAREEPRRETPVPPLLDRIVKPEPPEVPPLQVPPPTELQAAPAPVPQPSPEAAAPPPEAPIPLQRLVPPETVVIPAPAPPPAERAPVEVPAIPVRPAYVPPVELAPVEVPPVPAIPIRPAYVPPIELQAIPVPPLESIRPPRVEDVPQTPEPAPASEIPAAPKAAPAPERVEPRVPDRTPPARTEREPPKLEAPAASPAPVSAPTSPATPAKRDSPAGSYDPTAPTLDLDAMRKRAGQIAREGTGRRAVLPFPMPPLPERKSKMEDAIEKARKPDCRDAYKDLGLAAIVPLLANEIGEGTCRW